MRVRIALLMERIMHAKNTIIGHLNINSIMNKFDNLDKIVKAFFIFLISESKLDNTFPINQFTIGNYKVLDVLIIASEMV